jgi:hypothetical protein
MPRGGWLREVRRWACCAVCAAHRRAESRFWGVFIIAVHRAFACWVWGPGIAVLWSSCQSTQRVETELLDV